MNALTMFLTYHNARIEGVWVDPENLMETLLCFHKTGQPEISDHAWEFVALKFSTIAKHRINQGYISLRLNFEKEVCTCRL